MVNEICLGRVQFLQGLKNIVKNMSLSKKAGIDQLLIALFLAAMGLGLCIYFRNAAYTMFTNGITTMTSRVSDLMSGTVNNGSTGN